MTKEKLTVNELFSGIGSQRKALERLGIPHEVVGICEIDKYAIQSYEAIFGKTHNYGDISKVERLEYADLWTYSFPCTDISVAGNQKGIVPGTRSGLLYEVQRLLEVAKEEGTLPKYLLLENVKNLVGKKFKSQFDNWLFYLEQLGYDNYWQVLNAKNYGIPQNRERVFAISIRKDLNETFEFPKVEELTKRLADVLEDEVDEKYYISQDKVKSLVKNIEQKQVTGEKVVCEQRSEEGLRFFKNYAIGTLRTTDACGDKKVIELPCICASRGRNPENHSDTTVGVPTEQRLEINTNGTSNTITTVQKDNYVVEVKPELIGGIGEKNFGKQYRQGNRVYDSNSIAMCLMSGPVGNLGGYSYLYAVKKPQIIQVGNYMETESFGGNPQCGRVYDVDGISPTLNTMQGGDRQPKIVEGIRIRKLTPLECWRLMGFDDEDFKKAQASGVSNSQLYKQAGNSIVVNVLERIFKNLYRK